MTYTLAQLAYRTARELEVVREGTATGGSTTTIVDTSNRTEANDYWVGGTAWILRDSAGASAAPEGEYGVVSAFANATGTITLRAALTQTVASGDRYAVAKKRYSQDILIECVNRALQDLGTIPVTDTSTITTANKQTEYNLPIAANLDLRQVFLQTVNNDTDDNRWVEIFNWYIQRTATGTADILVFPYQPDYPYKLKLVYMAPHPELVLYGDKLCETVPLERVIPAATFHALNWYRQKTGANDKPLLDDIARYEQKMRDAERAYPIPAPRKVGRILMVSQGVSFPKDISDISTVRL